MNVLEALRIKKNFTDAEKALADYILSHTDDVLNMNIGQLARLAHCSTSTIVRLCQKMGLDGYRELRVELAKAIERRRHSNLQVNPDRPFIEGNATADIASSIATLSKQAIDATYAGLRMHDVRKAARLILGARRVAYYASGDSLVSAEMFANLLVKIGVVCTSGFFKSDFGSVSQLLDSRDVAIIVTHSGQLLETWERPISSIRSRGCKIVLITADLTAGERLMGTDCILTLPQGESRSQRLATFYSQACIRYVLNCIYAEAFSMNYQQNIERLDAIEHQFDWE